MAAVSVASPPALSPNFARPNPGPGAALNAGVGESLDGTHPGQ